MRPRPASTSHGVPSELLTFQSTLCPPSDSSAPELLKRFDSYVNDGAPKVGALHRGVLLREHDGWQLTVDVAVPPGDGPFPAIIFFHGGAWVMGSPWTHRRLSAELAARGLVVLSVDYRRAPKHRFPAAVDDALVAVEWARSHVGEYRGDEDRLVVGGDSAGANLAAAVLATGDADIACAALCYGIYNFHRALPALDGLLGGPGAEEQLYLPPVDFDRLREDPRVSPETNARWFPPTLLLAGEDDPLRPETDSLAGHLRTAGVSHRVHTARGVPHGFLQMPSHPAHDEALAEISAFVSRTTSLPDNTETS